MGIALLNPSYGLAKVDQSNISRSSSELESLKATKVQFYRYYRMIVLLAMKWVAVLFCAVAFVILLLNLLDLTLALHWGYDWYSALFTLAAIAIGLLVRSAVVAALRRI
jgi:hypothetical protein